MKPPASVLTWLSLMRAHAAVLDAVSARIEPALGIPLAWLEVLHLLSLAPDGQMRMQDLARSTLHSRSGLTRLADRMEEAGLLERVACATDRRGYHARMTPAGMEMLERGRPLFGEATERHVTAHLTDDEQRALRRALDALTEANPSERVACGLPGAEPAPPGTDKSVDGAASVGADMR